MIHGKRRNRSLFKRLTENWGYTKNIDEADEAIEEEEIPLDEQMNEEDEEDEEVVEEAAYPASRQDDDDEELEEGGKANRPTPEKKADGRDYDDRIMARQEESVKPDEDVVEEENSDSLEEAIRKAVKTVLANVRSKRK
jgi:hypothetical protein